MPTLLKRKKNNDTLVQHLFIDGYFRYNRQIYMYDIDSKSFIYLSVFNHKSICRSIISYTSVFTFFKHTLRSFAVVQTFSTISPRNIWRHVQERSAAFELLIILDFL